MTGAETRVTIRVKPVLICGIVIWMAALSARATDDSVSKLAQDPGCLRGLSWIDKNADWVTEQQIRLTEIAAPEFDETRRGEALKALFAASGFDVRTDHAGNVIAERAGADSKNVVLFVAHLDTVFPAGTDVRVKHEHGRLSAPGISDNGAGLAAVAALARALAESRIRTEKTIALSGDVGEEGEGNLRGIRALVEHYGSRLSAVIAVDGPSPEYITNQAIASRRLEAVITGPGGHSWSDFGMANPITALARGLVRFTATPIPDDPRTTYNFGVVEGGTSVNAIPSRASIKIDLRSEDESELARLEAALRRALQSGVNEELAATHSSNSMLQLSFRSLGTRPAGKLPEDSPLVTTIREVDTYLGNRSRLERSSTDANIPLSLGIQAVSLGGGGKGGGSHTSEEWFDPTGRELGLKRLFLTAVALAGLQS
jgi:acetylornithine deacetylase/succinyl-diaminopimelate desuccinylase-like protein